MAVTGLDTSALREFSEKVARYFLDFLQTDFKRQPAPRRRLLPDRASQIRLEQFPKLATAARRWLTQPVKEWKPITISRQTYTKGLSPLLLDFISKQIDAIPDEKMTAHARELRGFIDQSSIGGKTDHEAWLDETVQQAALLASDYFVQPIVRSLHASIERDATQADERAFDLEATLVAKLTEGLAQTLPAALNDYAATGDASGVDTVLNSQLEPSATRAVLKDAAQEFWTADAYDQMRELAGFISTGENLQPYLYVGTVTHKSQTYPIIYLPLTLTEVGGVFTLTPEPHIYVNHRAIEFILQDLAGGSSGVVSPISDRIIYLAPEDIAGDAIQRISSTLCPSLGLPAIVDLTATDPDRQSTPKVALRNALLIAAFDRADEALVNDYEQILAAAATGQESLLALFQNIVLAIIQGDPLDVRADVERDWRDTPLEGRLIAESPIPLNEEQRKILLALKKPDCHFVVVQGPPGTGKSHTISAIAFDAIMQSKSVLILSDKNEALDVVEYKLEDTFAAVRPSEDFPNPLLRLGKTGSNFSRLVGLSASEQIMREHIAAESHRKRLDKEMEQRTESLGEGLEEAGIAFSEEAFSDIKRLHDLEAGLEHDKIGICDQLRAQTEALFSASFDKFETALDGGRASSSLRECVHAIEDRRGTMSISSILHEARRRALAVQLSETAPPPWMRRFAPLQREHAQLIVDTLQEYNRLRRPVIGHLFRGAQIRALEQQLFAGVPTRDVMSLRADSDVLRHAATLAFRIADETDRVGLSAADAAPVYRLMADGTVDPGAPALVTLLEALIPPSLSGGINAIDAALQDEAERGGASDALLQRLFEYACLWGRCCRRFKSLAEFDYVGGKTQLERLHARRMANDIDGRFVDFVTNHAAESKALARVIKQKAKFPDDRFGLLRTAFPVIIGQYPRVLRIHATITQAVRSGSH